MSSADLIHSGLSKAIEGNLCSNTSNLWENLTDGVLKHFVVKDLNQNWGYNGYAMVHVGACENNVILLVLVMCGLSTNPFLYISIDVEMYSINAFMHEQLSFFFLIWLSHLFNAINMSHT